MKMKKYAYLLIIIVMFTIWCIDLLSFFSVEEIWLYAKMIYLVCGPFCIFGYTLELLPEDKETNTAKVCNICGKHITMNEDSVHYRPKNKGDNTEEYCEKCKSKISNNK